MRVYVDARQNKLKIFEPATGIYLCDGSCVNYKTENREFKYPGNRMITCRIYIAQPISFLGISVLIEKFCELTSYLNMKDIRKTKLRWKFYNNCKKELFFITIKNFPNYHALGHSPHELPSTFFVNGNLLVQVRDLTNIIRLKAITLQWLQNAGVCTAS